MKKAESIKNMSSAADEAALKIIHELELKNNQQINEEDLYTLTKALYPKEYQTKLETILNSKFLQAYYIVNLPK